MMTIMTLLLAAATFAAGGDTPVSEKCRSHENVEWSISYAFGLTDPKQKDLPRVLMVGDSICNHYREEVLENLKGRMNLSWWVSSYCVTSPEYLRILAFKLDEAKCDVVHFNNGLHSLWTPTADYVAAYEKTIRLIREKQPDAKIVWVNSTPVLDEYKEKKARELNLAVARMMREKFPEIPMNDLYSVMKSGEEQETFLDKCHPTPAAAKKLGKAVSDMAWALYTGKSGGFDAVWNWEPKRILGKKFLAGCPHWWGNVGEEPDWALYRERLVRPAWGGDIGLNDIKWFAPRPERERFTKLPYKVEDTFGPTDFAHRWADEVPKDMPFHTRMTDSWFPWFMKDEYDCDVADYEKFIAAHPNFICYSILNESDGSFGHDFAKGYGAKKNTDQEILAKIVKDFPPARKVGDRARLVPLAMKRERAMHFKGRTDFGNTFAQNAKWGHVLARNGIRGMFNYEMEMNASSAPWDFGMFHMRGVSRQWDVPFIWYTAPLIIGYTRDGKPSNTEWEVKRKSKPNAPENGGGSISLVMRNCFRGFMGGAAANEIENSGYSFYDDRGEGDPKPTKYCLAFRDVQEYAARTDRGAPFTPVLALTSLYEDFYRYGYNKPGCRDAFAPNAFFFTLVPTYRDDPYRLSDRKKGDQGCMWNSEFGDICDVMCPDAGQPSAEFAAKIAPYKWAFLIGSFDRKDFDRASVEGWVQAGGTLVVTEDEVRDGLIAESLAGLSFAGGTVQSGKTLLTADGKALEDFGYGYTLNLANVTGAVPLLKDENGAVVAYDNKAGKGRVITVTAYQSIPDHFFNRNLPEEEDAWFHKGHMQEVSSGKAQFPIQKHLLRLARDESMPVRVEGDIQWGCNILKDGSRLVWLINNKGVTKFEGEEAQIDHAYDAEVKVTDKPTGNTKTIKIKAGDYGTLLF